MTSRKTSVVIDEDLLEAVQHVLDTRTVRETIEHAFREVLRQRARFDEIEALARMDGLDLADAEVMAGAWRS